MGHAALARPRLAIVTPRTAFVVLRLRGKVESRKMIGLPRKEFPKILSNSIRDWVCY